MATIIRETDIDMDALRERVTREDGEAACCSVVDAKTLLHGLRRFREDGEGTHEIMRALDVVHAALTDAFDL